MSDVPEIVPVTGLRDAIRWRDALGEAVANLIKDYERRVPHSKIEVLIVSRTTVKTKIGTKRDQIVVLPKVVLTE